MGLRCHFRGPWMVHAGGARRICGGGRNRKSHAHADDSSGGTGWVVETPTGPIDAGTNGFILYGVSSNWSGAWMEKTGIVDSNDLWRGKIGRFPAGNVLEYGVGVEDGEGTHHYDNNGGSHFTFTVTNGEATTWIGDIYHWPTNGALTSGTNL